MGQMFWGFGRAPMTVREARCANRRLEVLAKLPFFHMMQQ